jgi:hypothetical protein
LADKILPCPTNITFGESPFGSRMTNRLSILLPAARQTEGNAWLMMMRAKPFETPGHASPTGGSGVTSS